MKLPFDVTISNLRRRLTGSLPGLEAQLRLAPVRSDAAERLAVQGRNCREAAVLAIFTPVDGNAHLLMTVRRPELAHHAGQVSFPGGRREPGEDLVDTALRETHEEIGLTPGEVEVLGPLTPLYIPPSNFCVYPFVGATRESPSLIPHDHEVERIVTVPLTTLQNETSLRRDEWIVRGERLLVPYFDIEGLTVWGATAMMLAELLALLD